MGELWRQTWGVCRRRPAVWGPVVVAAVVEQFLAVGRVTFAHKGLRWLAFHNDTSSSVLSGAHPSLLAPLATQSGLILTGTVVGLFLRFATFFCAVVACVATAHAVWRLESDVEVHRGVAGWNVSRIVGLSAIQTLAFVALPAWLATWIYSPVESLPQPAYGLFVSLIAFTLVFALAPLWLWVLRPGPIDPAAARSARIVAVAASAAAFAVGWGTSLVVWSFPGDVSSHLWTAIAKTVVSDLPLVPEFVAFALLVLPREESIDEDELPAAA